MKTGRPASNPRPPLGERIAQARKAIGLTQLQLAEKLGVSQRVVTYWERESVSLKPEQLSALADALEVSADFLLGRELAKKRGNGPQGKAKRILDAIAKMPRGQQEKVFDVIEPFIRDHTQNETS